MSEGISSNNISKVCPICNCILRGGIGSHFNKDDIHKDFMLNQKRLILNCCGKITAKETKIKHNIFLSETTIKKLWTLDFNSGKRKCPVCGKMLLKMGNHLSTHKEFIQREMDIAIQYYGKMSINEIIRKFNLFLNRKFIEKQLAKRYSKGYICETAHRLTAIKNKGHIAWNRGLKKETSEGVRRISENIKKAHIEGKTKNWCKGRTFDEMYGYEKANKLKESIGKLRRNKSFEEIYGVEKAREIKNKISTNHSRHMLGKKMSFKSRRKLSKSHKGKHVGDKNPSWKGGLSFEPYTLYFNDIFKEKIRERDNRTCKLCNLLEIDSFKLYKRKLIVHHIDYNKKNTYPQNCISLCVRCNGLVNKDREIWTKHFHDLLIKLYGYEYTQDQKIILDFTKND